MMKKIVLTELSSELKNEAATEFDWLFNHASRRHSLGDVCRSIGRSFMDWWILKNLFERLFYCLVWILVSLGLIIQGYLAMKLLITVFGK